MSVKYYTLLLLILFTFTSGVSAAETAVITLSIPETVVVPGPRLSLGDLGAIQGGAVSEREYLEKIDFGAAPFPGQVRILSKEYILYIIKQHQFLKELNLVMGAEVKIRVQAVCFKDTDIERTITDLLPKAPPVIVKKWVELNNIPKETWLNNDNWDLKAVVAGNLPELGPVLFKVIISSEKGRREMNISGRIRETAVLYRAKRDLPRFTEIKPDDFERVELELLSGKEQLGEIEGRSRITKMLRQGEVLRSDQMQPVPLVHKDQEVTVIVRGPKVEVTVIGIAKADGWLGDEILIINPTSKKSFRGRVFGENMVEVILK